jgi:hypothetical protein
VEGPRAYLYGLSKLEASGPLELWRTRVDGDNLFVFGRVTVVGDLPKLQITAVETAPSDRQIIDKRLAAVVPADDFTGRLAVAAWVRENAAQQGNREYWLESADRIISQTIDDAAAQAEADKNVNLLLQAMGWSMDLLHDTLRAARLGSAAWIRSGTPAAEEIARRMRRLDLEFYNGQWRPRGDALTQEFQDRFAAISWRDADTYYKLGRWADANAEVLPRARELSYRCYQAGFRANPNHNGIRRELGMEAVREGASVAVPQGDYRDSTSGLVVAGPQHWSRTEPIEGNATWIDPSSDTAFISLFVIKGADNPADFSTLWNQQLATLRAKTGFTSLAEEKIDSAQGEARHVRYSYREGRLTRLSDMIVVQNPNGKAAVRLVAGYAEAEQDVVRKQLLAMFAKVTIPIGEKEKGGGPPAPTPAPLPQEQLND